MKNPKADTAKANMPTSSTRQLNGGILMWDNGELIQVGCVICTTTTYNQTNNPKRNKVNTNALRKLDCPFRTGLVLRLELKEMATHSYL
jgi:hypothetical protein